MEINIELFNKMAKHFTLENFYVMAMYLTVLAGEGFIVCDKALDELIYDDIFGKESDMSRFWDLLEEERMKLCNEKEE